MAPMIQYAGWDHCPRPGVPVVLSIGNFDGVHRGHRAVLDTAMTQAREVGGIAWVLTFEPHPLKILRPEQAPPRLQTLDQTAGCLAHLELDGMIHQPFSRETARMTPSMFFEQLRRAIPDLHTIVIGHDFRFGKDAAGDANWLRQTSEAAGIRVRVQAPLCEGHERISSTLIRQALMNGRPGEAAQLLGRVYSVLGTVVHGRRQGRVLGFPTANLMVENDRLLPDGIYAAGLWIDGSFHTGAGYVPPQRYHPEHLVEIHLFAYDGDLYGRTLEAALPWRLRPHADLPSVEAMRLQIESDVNQLKVWWKESAPGPERFIPTRLNPTG